MTRYEAITKIIKPLNKEVLITSCGMISREACQINDRPRNLYLMAGMGCELAVGLGLAYTRPDLEVIVLSGDGSALMSYNTSVLYDSLNLPNLFWIILDNNAYATTGGQKALKLPKQKNLTIKVTNEQGIAPRIPLLPKEITKRFKDAIRK